MRRLGCPINCLADRHRAAADASSKSAVRHRFLVRYASLGATSEAAGFRAVRRVTQEVSDWLAKPT